MSLQPPTAAGRQWPSMICWARDGNRSMGYCSCYAECLSCLQLTVIPTVAAVRHLVTCDERNSDEDDEVDKDDEDDDLSTDMCYDDAHNHHPPPPHHHHRAQNYIHIQSQYSYSHASSCSSSSAPSSWPGVPGSPSHHGDGLSAAATAVTETEGWP